MLCDAVEEANGKPSYSADPRQMAIDHELLCFVCLDDLGDCEPEELSVHMGDSRVAHTHCYNATKCYDRLCGNMFDVGEDKKKASKLRDHIY